MLCYSLPPLHISLQSKEQYNMIESLILGGLSLAGGIAGSLQSSRNAKSAADKMRQQEEFNRNLFAQQYYQDILNRADTQNLLRQLRNDMKTHAENTKNTAAVTGATPEAVAAAKANNARAYADAVANIAATGAQRKDAALANFQNQQNQAYNNWVQAFNNNAQHWSNFATQAFQMGANTIGNANFGGKGTAAAQPVTFPQSQYNKPHF